MFRAELELQKKNTHTMSAKEVFLYSQCQKRNIEKDFHPCFSKKDFWFDYINSDADGMYVIFMSILMYIIYFKI